MTGAALEWAGDALVSADGRQRYRLQNGIPLLAEQFCSVEGRSQQAHYEAIAAVYAANLRYPQTEEYTACLDRALLDLVDFRRLGTVAEICCGLGEAVRLLGPAVGRGIGIDVSPAMLAAAADRHAGGPFIFVQADATSLPLAADSIDSIFLLGGVHHINDRRRLFAEIARVLRPGGRCYFREPVSDFLLWRVIRSIVYRVSPILDHRTEHPLRYDETVPLMEEAGLRLRHWQTFGFLGFCFFMNADVLIFNRLFRFIPGIRALTRAAAALDARIVALPFLRRAGLQVIAAAEKVGRARDGNAGGP
jgi:SAM-dependent methyltransferase